MENEVVTDNSNATSVTRRKVANKDRTISDFQLLRIIGTGTFGKVYLALFNGESVALKVLNKSKIIELKQTAHIQNEKNILSAIEHPFIVNLIETFQDKLNIYLVLDFV